MTDIICSMEDCIHRSKRPMRKYKKRDGSECYKCTLDMVLVKEEGDAETYELLGRDLPCCARYEKGVGEND